MENNACYFRAEHEHTCTALLFFCNELSDEFSELFALSNRVCWPECSPIIGGTPLITFQLLFAHASTLTSYMCLA